MRHDHLNFIQIRRAIVEAGQDTRLSVDDVRAFLDALPEPQDDWQECKFADIRTGDRVRWSVPASEDKESYEIIVRHLSEEPRLLYSNTGSYHFPDGAILYRIPAPVEHPDPEEHPVIVNVAVDKPGTNSTHRYDYATWDIGEYYDCWSNDGKYYGAWPPSAIVEWSPAKVVADDDR